MGAAAGIGRRPESAGYLACRAEEAFPPVLGLPAHRRLSLRGGGSLAEGEQAAGGRDSGPGGETGDAEGGRETQGTEACKCGGIAGDEQHPLHGEVSSQQTTEELMQKMVGALVTVTLKIGPQVRGRLLTIDEQWNMMLQRPVEQWVNGTLAAVDDADVFVRSHNVVDFGVLRGSKDPATVKILQDMGIRPGEGWDDSPPAPSS